MSEERRTTETSLVWETHQKVLVPPDDMEGRFGIRIADWKRIRQCASEAAGSPRGWLLMGASALFGIGASTLLSLIPLAGTPGSDPWVIPLYICVGVFSLLTAIVFTALDCQERKREKRWSERLKEDMADVESMFPTPPVESEGVQLRAETATREVGGA